MISDNDEDENHEQRVSIPAAQHDRDKVVCVFIKLGAETAPDLS